MRIPHGPLLVVEDIDHIRSMLELTLRWKGYPVVTAVDGKDALEKIANQKPAVIISDIMMPRLDGFGLIQQVRVDPNLKDIPIIIISATYVAKEDREFAMRLGAVRFLEKPVDTEEFLLTIAEVLTQGMPDLPTPISEKAFQDGYRARLTHKLRQKNKQILRTKRLLKTLKNEEKPAFEAILAEEEAQRVVIQQELDGLYKILEKEENKN